VQQALGNAPLGPVQASEEDASPAIHLVGHDVPSLQLELEYLAHDLARDLQEFGWEHPQLILRQAAVALVHGLGQRISDAARARIIAVFSIPSRPATTSAVRKPMPRMSRANR
jgi:hypothetical protein